LFFLASPDADLISGQQPPWKKSGKPLAMPAMLPAKLANEKADKASVDRNLLT
jgi:hypothetical protein